MKSLNEIGFYTLSDDRALNSSVNSNLWRCELILTDACNFKCVYCRGLRNDISGTMPIEKAISVVSLWCKQGLQNVRFSGGEPTLYSGLLSLVEYCKNNGVKRIAVSTNGSASKELYQKLIDAGVNDFSVSLDACCSSVADKIAGGIEGAFDVVIDNIKWLSSRTYTTVGIVVNEENIDSCLDTIKFADSLGVSDIRVIPSAQYDKLLSIMKLIPGDILRKHKILNYRASNVFNGRHTRGLSSCDSKTCYLALDDMAIAGNYHFPCIIYMREKGNPIGVVSENIRQEREEWVQKHDCHKDAICKKNCLDVCIDFNNKAKERTSCAQRQESVNCTAEYGSHNKGIMPAEDGQHNT